MKVTHLYLAALGLAGASLSSCSRSTYSFSPATPAYLNSVPTVATAPAPAERPVPAVAVPARATAAAPAKAASARPAYAAATHAAVAPAMATLATPAAPKVNLAQRLVLKKLAKQVAKAQNHSQNVASTTETAGRGGSFTIAIIGLIALVVGIIASSGLLITIGSIVLVVGLILALLSIF